MIMILILITVFVIITIITTQPVPLPRGSKISRRRFKKVAKATASRLGYLTCLKATLIYVSKFKTYDNNNNINKPIYYYSLKLPRGSKTSRWRRCPRRPARPGGAGPGDQMTRSSGKSLSLSLSLSLSIYIYLERERERVTVSCYYHYPMWQSQL